MKKLSPLSMGGLLVFALLQFALVPRAFAQTTKSGITIRVTVGGVSTDFIEGECGYGPANFGVIPAQSLCAQAQWARDVVGQDSLICDSVPAGSLAGKIALVRRGGCPVAANGTFAAKSLKAQTAGAIAVLYANNSAVAGQTDCTAPTLAASNTAADAAITIPVFSMSRSMAAFVGDAVNSGQTVEICLHPPNVRIESSFFPVQNAQTPVSQIGTDTFGFSVNVTNVHGQELTNVVLKAQVMTAAGAELYSTSVTLPTLAGDVADSVFVIPGLYPPELPIGEYLIVYSTDSDPLGGLDFPHVTRNNFSVTTNLFAKDNNITNAIRPGTIPDAGYALANLYVMSTGTFDHYKVNTVELAHYTNPGVPAINQITSDISLFRVKDTLVNAGWSFAVFDRSAYLSNSFILKGTGSFIPPADAAQGQIHQVEIIDFDSALPGVPLENGAHYVVSAFYPDSSRFSFVAVDEDVDLAGPNGIYTLSFSDQWYGGFQGGPVAALIRMYIDLVVTTDDQPLPDSYMKVFPNPIKDVLNLGLSLEEPTDLTVTIAEMSGRTILIQDKYGMTNETLTYQLPQLASGMYLARIATKEGTLTKKFVVQK